MDWIAYLEQDLNGYHREDYLAAKICAEIRRSWVDQKSKNSVSEKEFMLEFKLKKEVKKMTREEASRIAKAGFGVPSKDIDNG